MKILLIAGYGRSGSTLLEILLSKTLNAGAVGELKYIWQRGFLEGQLCGCGEKLNECTFWKDVRINLARSGRIEPEECELTRKKTDRHSIHFKRRILRLPQAAYKIERRKYIDTLRSLYLAIWEESKVDLIIDSSKDPAHIDMVLEAFPEETYLLQLVRDSRAVAHSFATPKQRTAIHWKTEMMDKVGPFRASVDWSFINLATEHLPIPPERRKLLRYEDFIQHHQSQIDSIISWLNVPSNINSSFEHSVSGNPIRFDKDIIVKQDERWKTEQAIADRILVSMLTFPLLKKYNYDL